MTDNESHERLDLADPSEPPTAIFSSAVASVSEIAGVRSESSAALLLVGCGRRLVDDVALIVTELAVNAFEHGWADHVDIRIDAGDGGTIEVRVSHEEDLDHFDVAEVPVMAAADDLAGRGRAIVAGLTTRFETDRVPPNRVEQLAVVAP